MGLSPLSPTLSQNSKENRNDHKQAPRVHNLNVKQLAIFRNKVLF